MHAHMHMHMHMRTPAGFLFPSLSNPIQVSTYPSVQSLFSSSRISSFHRSSFSYSAKAWTLVFGFFFLGAGPQTPVARSARLYLFLLRGSEARRRGRRNDRWVRWEDLPWSRCLRYSVVSVAVNQPNRVDFLSMWLGRDQPRSIVLMQKGSNRNKFACRCNLSLLLSPRWLLSFFSYI